MLVGISFSECDPNLFWYFELLLIGDPSSFGHNLVGLVHFGSAPIYLVEQSSFGILPNFGNYLSVWYSL